jgi:hypothetical protein
VRGEGTDHVIPFLEFGQVVAYLEMLLIRFPVALRRVIRFLDRRFHHLSQGLGLWSILAEGQLKFERPGAERFELGFLAGEELVCGTD